MGKGVGLRLAECRTSDKRYHNKELGLSGLNSTKQLIQTGLPSHIYRMFSCNRRTICTRPCLLWCTRGMHSTEPDIQTGNEFQSIMETYFWIEKIHKH